MAGQMEFNQRIARIQARAGQPAICHAGVVDAENPASRARAALRGPRGRSQGLSRHALPLGVPVLGLAILVGAFWSDLAPLLMEEPVMSASLN